MHEIWPDPVVHIGFHKTATTYLQNLVFSAQDVFQHPWGLPSGEAVEQFALVHPERFYPAALRAEFFEGCDPKGGRIPLISHEALSGNPMHGRYDLDRVAGRIKATFPNARIVIGIREQLSAIASSYYQYVRGGGTRPLVRLLTAPRQGPGYRPVMRLEHFEYDLTVRHYQRLFGADAVLVLPIEQLRRAPDQYFQRLGALLGEDRAFPMPAQVVNARRSGLSMRIERALNHVIPVPDAFAARYSDNPLSLRAKNRFLRGLDRLLAARAAGDDPLRAEIRDFVGDYFIQPNQRLGDLTGLDLRALGYAA